MREKNFVRDLSGRCFEKTGFPILRNVPESNLVKIGAPLLFCEAVTLETSENAFDASGACTSVCPFQEAFKLTLFSINDDVLKAFMKNGFLAQLSEGTGHTVTNHGIPNTIESIVRYVSVKTALPQDFQRKCSKVLNSRKIIGRDYYIQLLAYNSIF